MFGFLKDTLKKAVTSFSKQVEKEVEEGVNEEHKETIVEEVKGIEPIEKVEEENIEVPETEETIEALEKEKERLKKEIEEEEKKTDDIKEETKEEIQDKINKEEQLNKDEPSSEEAVKQAVEELPEKEVKDIEEADISNESPEVKKEKEKLGIKQKEKTEQKPIEKEEEQIKEEVKDEPLEKEKKDVEIPAKKIVNETKKVIEEPEAEELSIKEVVEEQVSVEPEEDIKSIEEVDIPKINEEVIEAKPVEKKGFIGRLFGKKEAVEKDIANIETKKEEESETKKEVKEQPKKEDEGFKISNVFTKKKLSEQKFEDIFWELEIALLENNVAVEVIETIRENLKTNLVDTKLKRFGVDEIITKTLKDTIGEMFDYEPINLLQKIKSKKPYIMAFVGINGVGKTTNLAKVAHYLKKNGVGCIIAAADTFRVAAIEQMQAHADKLGIRMIKHDYGSDAAAVCFDAIEHAKANNKDVVLIDTAGRSNANVNLMAELKKINRIANPDMTIFVGDSLTGNDAVEQAKEFDNAVGIDAIILSKADVDEKGGAAVSISHVTKKPILFFGTGQTYDDLTPFNKEVIMKNLGL